MLAEMKSRIGEQLEQLSHELNRSMSARLAGTAETSPGDLPREVERVYERRIRLLGQLMAGLAYVDPRALSVDRVGYGSVVRIRDLRTQSEEICTLVAGHFVEHDEEQLSISSPLGNALLGRQVGEIVTVAGPNGVGHYEIIEFLPLPDRLGPWREEPHRFPEAALGAPTVSPSRKPPPGRRRAYGNRRPDPA